jgi:hypothetical protein
MARRMRFKDNFDFVKELDWVRAAYDDDDDDDVNRLLTDVEDFRNKLAHQHILSKEELNSGLSNRSELAKLLGLQEKLRDLTDHLGMPWPNAAESKPHSYFCSLISWWSCSAAQQ